MLHDNVSDFIKRLDKAQQQLAESERRKIIAGKMLHDAPPQQIRLKYLVWEIRSGRRFLTRGEGPFFDTELLPRHERHPPMRFDLTALEGGKQNMTNALSPYLSKSESVFCEVMDNLDEMIDSGAQPSILASHQLCALLSASHAFDKGNSQQVQWIDGERQDVIAWIDPHRLFPGQPRPLPELDSKDSVAIQVADFAAGIAREIWHRNSLPHLVSTFDYVTYNGKRVSETDAISIETDLARRL